LNRPESWKTWLPLLGVLVVFAVVTAVWPTLANAFSLPSISFGGGSSTPVPYEPEPIHLEALKTSLAAGPLASVAEALPDTLSPFVALGVVAGVIIGGIVVVGGGLSFIFRLLSGIRDNTIESETFQKHQSALEQRQREQIKKMRNGRTIDPVPSHKMPRWSVLSNALITLMFVGFATMVVVRNFFPEGVTELNGEIVNITTPAFGVAALIALIIMGIRLRPQRLEAIDTTDYNKIPWDFMAVLITGLVILGLGIGFMVYINAG
jgi:hypothetical protein